MKNLYIKNKIWQYFSKEDYKHKFVFKYRSIIKSVTEMWEKVIHIKIILLIINFVNY